MTKFDKGFFDDKEVLFLGVSNKYKMFCKMAYKELTKHNIKIFPMNIDSGDFEFKIYKDFSELPKMPRIAYTILDIEDNRKIIDDLKIKGIKKILFHSKNVVDQNILDECQKSGIETSIACPLMVYGSGLHRFHGFFSGYKGAK